MNLMSPVESMMLLAESPGHPMHVAGLQLFAPPQGAGPEFVRAASPGFLERATR